MKQLQTLDSSSFRMGLFMLALSISMASCGSDSKNTDPETDTDSEVEVPGGPEVGSFQSLSQLSAKIADSDPIDDGLDQVQADLLSQFGSADSDPFPVADGDTVQTLLTR